MKFAMKEALVLTISYGGVGREEHRACPRFVFYIDTDAEKIAFIDWYLTKLQVTDLFEGAGPFDAFMANFPDGSSALYFECNCGCEEYEKAERVFPLGSDANKLALFELIITGELGTIFGNMCSCGLDFKKVKARVAMDTEKATAMLETNLPVELAEKIVASAVSEDGRGGAGDGVAR
jgi:hypothetical protein